MAIVYKELVINKDAIIHLYLDNEWFAYTNEPTSLFKGLNQSLDLFGAYDDDLLVGLIRTIGDANTIVYIQDILVLNDYQRQGIGKTLMKIIVDKYPSIRQICLTTDNTEKTIKFYESIGFVNYDTIKTLGFLLKK